MSDSEHGRQVSPQSRSQNIVSLGALPSIDLSFLPEAQRDALMADYAKGVLDIAKKAHELHVDVNVLKATLTNLADTTKSVAESGSAITVSHTQTTSVGRTEVKMGNTEEARSGKLSKSQTGETDWNPYYIFAGIAAIVLIAFLFASRR